MRLAILQAELAAPIDMVDCTFELACGVQRLSEREMQRNPLLLGHFVTLKSRLHLQDVVLEQSDALQVGQGPPARTIPGIEGQRGPDRGHGVTHVPQGFQEIAVTEPVSGDLMIE